MERINTQTIFFCAAKDGIEATWLLSRFLAVVLTVMAGLTGFPAVAQETYNEPAAFLSETFGGQAPAPQAVWLTPELREAAEDILGHPFNRLRIRYWREGQRTAWILDEIGKEELITAGFVVEDAKLVDVQVLVYRESRGWEVRYPAFTAQFIGASLEESFKLSQRIDGISGATLSVRAMRNMARLALMLHNEVSD